MASKSIAIVTVSLQECCINEITMQVNRIHNPILNVKVLQLISAIDTTSLVSAEISHSVKMCKYIPGSIDMDTSVMSYMTWSGADKKTTNLRKWIQAE